MPRVHAGLDEIVLFGLLFTMFTTSTFLPAMLTGEPANRRTGEPANRRTGEPANRRTGEPAFAERRAAGS